MTDFPESDKIVFDIYSTLLELLVTLSSALVVGLITFFDSVKGAGVPPWAIRLSVLLFGFAIVLGLVALMRLSGELSGRKEGERTFDEDTPASDIIYELGARIPAAGAVVLYFIGMLLLAVGFFCASGWCIIFCAPTAG